MLFLRRRRWHGGPIVGNDSYNFFFVLSVYVIFYIAAPLCLCIMIYILFTVYNLSDGVKNNVNRTLWSVFVALFVRGNRVFYDL